MSKKYIALYIPSLDGGGAEKVFLTLANYWVSEGHKVDLILTKAKGVYLNSLDNKVRLIELGSTRVLFDVQKLRKYITINNPDVIYSALPHCNVALLLGTLYLKNKPQLIISEHASFDLNQKVSFKNRVLNFFRRTLYLRAKFVISVSEGVKNNCINALSLPANLIKVIHNPIYSETLIESSLSEVKHPWFTLQVPVVVSVGRLSKVKDFSTLINAFFRVRNEMEAKLIILGEGDERVVLERLITDLKLTADVDLYGFTKNPYSFIRKADLFCLSSKREGFGNVLVEALACDTNVISTDCPFGPREILENGKWGKLVPVGDSDKLAAAILEALCKDKKIMVSERAKDFSVSKIADEYLSLLE